MQLHEATPFERFAIHYKMKNFPHSDLEGAKRRARDLGHDHSLEFNYISSEARVAVEKDDRGNRVAEYCVAMIWLEAKEEVLKLRAKKLTEQRNTRVHVTRFNQDEWPEEKADRDALLSQNVANPQIVDLVRYVRPDSSRIVAVFYSGQNIA